MARESSSGEAPIHRSRGTYRGEEQASLSARIYDAVKADIMSLNLAPGTLLLEKQLADKFEVSRTPVREALRRLEQDGLARIIARKGAFIPEVSLRDALEIDEIRLLLEVAAARKAASTISFDKLDEFEADLDALRQTAPEGKEYRAIFDIDRRLHEAILRAAGNRWMRDTVLRLYNIIYRIRDVNTEKRYIETMAELRALIAALRSRDAGAAEKAMQEHIANAKFDFHTFL